MFSETLAADALCIDIACAATARPERPAALHVLILCVRVLCLLVLDLLAFALSCLHALAFTCIWMHLLAFAWICSDLHAFAFACICMGVFYDLLAFAWIWLHLLECCYIGVLDSGPHCSREALAGFVSVSVHRFAGFGHRLFV